MAQIRYTYIWRLMSIIACVLATSMVSASESEYDWEKFFAEPPLPSWAIANKHELFASVQQEHVWKLINQAFTGVRAERREQAYYMLKEMLHGWVPKIPNLNEKRNMVQDVVVKFSNHDNAEIRRGIVQLLEVLHSYERMVALVTKIIKKRLRDENPEVRLAALGTALAFETGYLGGCLVHGKSTSFDISKLQKHALKLFVEDPDVRVRCRSLMLLSYCRLDHRKLLVQYFSNADRQYEMSNIASSVYWVLRRAETQASQEEAAVRQGHFLRSLLKGEATARRNALSLFFEWGRGYELLTQSEIGPPTVIALKRDSSLASQTILKMAKYWSITPPDDLENGNLDQLRAKIIEGLLAN